MKLESIKHPIHDDNGGRVFIGDVWIADVYDRSSAPDLFNSYKPKFEFVISPSKRHQREGNRLDFYRPSEERHLCTFVCTSIKEGLDWLNKKLNSE